MGHDKPAVNEQLISRWENGHQRASGRYRVLLDHVFTANLTSLSVEDLESEVNRRKFLMRSAGVGLAAVGSGLGTEPWLRVSAVLRGESRVDSATLDGLSSLTAKLSELFQPISPVLLVAPVTAHLGNIGRLLHERSLAAPARRRLLSIAAETSILLGWVSKEHGDIPSAQGCFLSAIDLARDADDQNLGAYALASASTLPEFRTSPQQSLELLSARSVRGFDYSRSTASTQIWLHCLTAEVHTRTGDDSAALSAIDAAERQHATADIPGDPRPVLGYFDEAALVGERWITGVRLGRSDGDSDLTSTLAALADFPKTQSRLLTNSARSHLQRGELDSAVEAARRSLDLAESTGSQVGIDDLASLKQDLQPHANIQEVQELLAAL